MNEKVVSPKLKGKVRESEKSHRCPQCSECFKYRRHYDKHMIGHKQNNCKYCGKLFTVRKKLAVHLHEEHKLALKDSKHCCRFCGRRFVKKVALYLHYRIHSEGKNVCLHCGQFFSETNDFVKHQEKHKYEKPFKCEKCEDRFSRRQQYLLHLQGHEKYECLTCKESFSAQCKLIDHKKNGHEIKEFEQKHVCDKCQRTFPLHRSLVLHQRSHKDVEPYNCTDCSKMFTSQKSYSKHLRTVTHRGRKSKVMVEGGVFICDFCGKTCKEKRALSLHLTRTHSKEEPKKCSYCDYKTRCKSNLKRHMEFHIKERKFICECCGSSFHMLSTLKEHFLYMHSEERNFDCTNCGKSFKRKCSLNRHMQDHSENRPYICDCGQSYKRMSHLKRHKESSHGFISQPGQLCRLRCDDTGVLVPIADESGSKLRKNMSLNSKFKGSFARKLVLSKNEVKVDLQLMAHDSCAVADDRLALFGIGSNKSAPNCKLPEVTMELRMTNSSVFPEISPGVQQVKESSILKHGIPNNCLLIDKIEESPSDFETVSTTVNFQSNTILNMSVMGTSNVGSDCQLGSFQTVGLSTDQVTSQSSHSQVVSLIQEPEEGLPVVNVVQVITPGNMSPEETLVLFCLSAFPDIPASGECQQSTM